MNEETIIVIEWKNNELRGKIKKEFVVLRAKTYSYLKGNNDIDKKQQAQKYNLNLRLSEMFRNSSIKINHLEKIKIDRENFIKRSLRIHKNNKLILKTQQIFTN